jgi:hypothetical protein
MFDILSGYLSSPDSAPKTTGLFTLYDSGERDGIDICIVHGLSGSWESPWLFSANRPKTDKDSTWAQSLLPLETSAEPKGGRILRIFSYGYDTHFPSSDYLTTRILYHQSRKLVHELCCKRQQAADREDGAKPRPIVLIGHTLGGVLIQSALTISSSARDELRSLYLSTVGVIFLGTPFRGTPQEWSQTFVQVVVETATDPKELRDELDSLETDAIVLRNLLEPFIAISSDIDIVGFTLANHGNSGEVC